MKEYAIIAVALISGLFALLGVFVSNKHNQIQLAQKIDHDKEERKNDILRERLEELYTLFTKWAGTTIIHHVTYRKVMDGTLTYNQALDLDIERKSNFDSHRMFMLAELYFSECHELLEEVKKARDNAASIQAEYKEIYRASGSPSEEHANLLTSQLNHFNLAVDEYKSALATYAKKV